MLQNCPITRTVKHFQVANNWWPCSITIPEHYDHKLVIARHRNHHKKKWKKYEVRGDKSDRSLRNQIWHAPLSSKTFRIVLATGEEPVVKIYTKSANEADKGYREFIERKWLMHRNSTLFITRFVHRSLCVQFHSMQYLQKLKTSKTIQNQANFYLATSCNNGLFIYHCGHRMLKPAIVPKRSWNDWKRTHHLRQ